MRRLAPFAFLLLIGCPKPPAYPECRNDDDCKDRAQVCVNNVCRECRDDAQCAQKPGTVCRDNACQPKLQCQENKDCPAGQKCAQNKCVPECTEATADRDCGDGRKCAQGRCVEDTCSADSDCSAGKACVQGRCLAQGSAKLARLSCDLKPMYFDFDDATLSPDARSVLDTDWQCLKQQGDARITVAGHTDERGTTEYNLALGERRAESVRKYLAGLGADPKRIKTVSFGKERPVDPGHDEAAWSKNRRAEVTVEAPK